MNVRALHTIALILAVTGAINWGLVGLFEYDLVANLFDGQSGPISRTVYSVVGVAGLLLAVTSLALASSHADDRRPGTPAMTPAPRP